MKRHVNHPLKASAPGTLMLMGEHAVLHGKHALCAAVQQRMEVTLTPRSDRQVIIQSALGDYEGCLNDFEVCKPYTFALEAIKRAKPQQGFQLSVRSDFSSTIGFGSSAAITVSIVSLLRALAGKPFDRAGILNDALEVVRAVQGTASGSDVAAAIYGGIVYYRANPMSLEPLRAQLSLSVCYAGYKTPTPEVIAKIEAGRRDLPQHFEHIFSLMDACTHDAAKALRSGDLLTLGKLFSLHHGCQSALGCSDETLEFLVHQLRNQSGIYGSKISGSGLGDCVIALGNPQASVAGYDHFPVKTDPEGVRLES
ncbi:mevalonate kinase [Kiritimatiellota bacterium B12222]|nr:mevalonate kinase [Kiritimatiellota bacterium B12222]